MDVKVVVETLQNTYDALNHQAAEAALKQLEQQPGFISCLLQIITIPEVPLPIKQAAIIRLKNLVREFWDIKEGARITISEDDRKIVKDNILEAIVFQHASVIRVQLLTSLYHIIRTDFPDAWPSLLPGIVSNIQSQEQVRVYGALCALRMVFKKYQYRVQGNRQPVEEMIAFLFPGLLQMLKSLVQECEQSATPEQYAMMHVLVKILFLATQLRIPEFFKGEGVIDPWIECLLKVLKLPLHTSSPITSEEELEKHSLWKAKKWSARIMYRVFDRFGRPKSLAEGEQEFGKYFFDRFSTPGLNLFLELLDQKSKGAYVSSRVIQYCFMYLELCVGISSIWKSTLKSRAEWVIVKCILPGLSLTPLDLEIWEENPQEFVRKQFDFMEEFRNPTIAAQNLLVEVVKLRTRDTLNLVLQVITQILEQYKSTPVEQQNFIQKESALRMFGCLRKLLLSKEEFKPAIEGLLINHVFPEFQHNHGVMRARACKVVGEYSRLEYSDKNHHAQAVTLVCDSLKDKDLPVQMESAIALSRIVRDETVVEFLRPQLPLILEQFFKLYDEIGQEEVVSTLGTLIGQFGDEIAPFAINLTKRLATMFHGIVASASVDDDDSMFTAGSCMKAITILLYSLENKPEMYAELEPIIAPLVDQMICEDGIEYFDDVLEIVACFTYYPPTVTPYFWNLFPRLIHAFHHWAADFISNLLVPIDNYISKDPQTFLAKIPGKSGDEESYFKMALTVVQVLFDDDDREIDAQHAAKMLESIVGHCKGQISDDDLRQIIQLLCVKLSKAQEKRLVVQCLNALAAAVYANPVVFVTLCGQAGDQFTADIFGMWFKTLEEMTHPKHITFAVLGLSSIMQLPLDKCPNGIQESMPTILNGIVLSLSNLEKLEEDNKDGAYDEDFSDDDFEQFDDLDDDQDALDETENISDLTDRIQNHLLDLVENVHEDDYVSPLDDIDAFIFFASCLEGMSTRHPEFYQSWGASLGGDAGIIDHIYQVAATRKQKEEEAKSRE